MRASLPPSCCAFAPPHPPAHGHRTKNLICSSRCINIRRAPRPGRRRFSQECAHPPWVSCAIQNVRAAGRRKHTPLLTANEREELASQSMAVVRFRAAAWCLPVPPHDRWGRSISGIYKQQTTVTVAAASSERRLITTRRRGRPTMHHGAASSLSLSPVTYCR